MNNDSELPEYRAVTSPNSNLNGSVLASGSRRTEHNCYLENNKKHKWISLFVHSRAGSPTSLPVFYEGDVIQGRVELDLGMGVETIKAVTITVQGGTTSVGQEELLFHHATKVLWDPTATPAQPASPKFASPKKITGKHSWPFTLTLPNEALVSADSPTKGKKSLYPLPPSFSERASPAYIDYKLIVTVKRGILRVNQMLSTSFGYVPVRTAPPPHALRRLAYQEQSPLIGPDGDPEGWKVLPDITIQGTLFNTKEIKIVCQLAVANPLTYAVGSPIPLSITIQSDDPQALDLLATPSAIKVLLVRSMATGSDATDETQTRRSNNFFLESVSQAFFWPSEEGAPEQGKRVLHGELDLSKRLKPSFLFPRLSIRYTLDFQALEAPGFVPSVLRDGGSALVSERVTLVLYQAAGVVPRSHAPPGYERPQGGDYNKSMGLLENGNQRFYHHHR